MKSACLLADVEKVVRVIIVRNAHQVKSKIYTIYLFLKSISSLCTFYKLNLIPLLILAQVTFSKEFPALWFSWDRGQSSMLYKGPKDIDSLMFFINDKMGIGSLSRKVIEYLKH